MARVNEMDELYQCVSSLLQQNEADQAVFLNCGSQIEKTLSDAQEQLSQLQEKSRKEADKIRLWQEAWMHMYEIAGEWKHQAEDLKRQNEQLREANKELEKQIENAVEQMRSDNAGLEQKMEQKVDKVSDFLTRLEEGKLEDIYRHVTRIGTDMSNGGKLQSSIDETVAKELRKHLKEPLENFLKEIGSRLDMQEEKLENAGKPDRGQLRQDPEAEEPPEAEKSPHQDDTETSGAGTEGGQEKPATEETDKSSEEENNVFDIFNK